MRTPMLPTLLLGGALVLGQPPAQPAFTSPSLLLPSQAAPQPGLQLGSAPGAPGPLPGATAQNGKDESSVTAKGSPSDGSPAGNGASECNGKEKKENPNWYNPCFKPRCNEGGSFCQRLYRAYYKEFFPEDNGANGGDQPEPPRRALPAPLTSPPMPSGEWQGYPLIGVPPTTPDYPLMQAIYGGPFGDALKDSRVKIYGWINASGNWSTSKNSNTPDSYWIVPNRFVLDQFVLRIERLPDTVQTDHIDWGFRATGLYGIDYRYMTAGGWFSEQLLKNNQLYGADPTELYVDLYVPWVAQGMIVRVGRWIACPDIETQFAPDNYMGTHSLLFTFDTYTQTGVWFTLMLNKQWSVQAGINAGNDMAPWYIGATPCGTFGVRWVSLDNNDSVYLMLNQINNAEFRHFFQYGQPLGHDNFNYLVGTWQHKFSDWVHTKTEGYFMWQRNAELGGTPSAGPVEPFGGGGGDGVLLPGMSLTYGLVNYTMCHLSKQAFFTVRNEWWRDERGMRSGFPGTYTSHAVGLTYSFNSVLQVRPEIGYYRNWTNKAFDLGTKNGMTLYGFDVTYRF
jgi:hypothetical protein